MNDSARADRAERMFYMRQLGMPLKAIAARFDLTITRVRQILEKRERWASHPNRLVIDNDCSAEIVEYACRELASDRYNPRQYVAKAAWSLSGIQ